jgi:hypothetical protein
MGASGEFGTPEERVQKIAHSKLILESNWAMEKIKPSCMTNLMLENDSALLDMYKSKKPTTKTKS